MAILSAAVPPTPPTGSLVRTLGGLLIRGSPNLMKINKTNENEAHTCKYVYDHNAERAAKDAEKLGAEVADLDTILNDASIDAVVICSETNQHLDLVKRSCAAGKAMFVEKPLGMGAEDAATMADMIEEAGVLFQTGFFMRGNPQLRFLKQQIDDGAFGKITRMRMSNCHSGAIGGWFDTDWRWMANVEQAGCGGFGDLGFHIIDIMLWMLGDVAEVSATIKSIVNQYENCDETGEGALRFANGVMGSISAGWVDIADPVKLQIAGTEGHATIVNGELRFQSKVKEEYDGSQALELSEAGLGHPFSIFLEHLSGDTSSPLISAREAARGCAVVEALYAAHANNSWEKPKAVLAGQPA